jgi:glycosyltransferase involved in cell wall biosynthesis
MANRELWVVGYPSFVGGADTELDHMIDLWRVHDVHVHLVPTSVPDLCVRQMCDARGCVTHTYRDDLFGDKILISYCNGEFLNRLPRICMAARPRAVLWANCMTWCFEAELQAHRHGMIDYFLFQSTFQRQALLPKLQQYGAVRELEGYRPFFNPHNQSQALEFRLEDPREYFGVGRVSRDDADKYSQETWMTFGKVSAPLPVKVFLLGFGEGARGKCGLGTQCPWLDWMTWLPGAIPVHEFYRRIHTVIHLTGGSRENWPRFVLESWATGVPVIVDDDYGVGEMVTDGMNGFKVKTSDEASFRASQLAFDEPLRQQMARAGYATLMNEHANPERSFEPFRRLFNEVA